MIILVLLCCILLFLFGILYLHNLFLCHQRLKKSIHLSGPPFSFFFGNTHELWSTQYFSRLLQSWTKKYGKTYVYFEGQTPVYVSSDVEFLHQVFVKQFFLHFVERKKTPFERQVDENLTNLVSANGLSWKHQRHIINPTFSAINLKGMSITINKCIDQFLELIQKEESNYFNIFDKYKRLSLDILLQCEFGVKTDVQTNQANRYIVATSGFFDIDLRLNIFAKAGVLVPSLADLLLSFCMRLYRWTANLKLIKPIPIEWLIQNIQTIVQDRLVENNTSENQYDLLQLLIDARTEDSTDPQTRLTINEIVANSVIFLLAGYESTSSALAYCSYVLARNMDEQQKLHQEINETWPDDNILTYDFVHNSLPYLDLFIKEVLRMFPIGNVACTRHCIESTEVCGIPIDKDSIVQMDMYSLHYSTELWGPVDPNVFFPERHKEKRHRLAFVAFGNGPKNCVGQRFALLIIKLTLIRLLRLYSILPAPDIEQRLKIKERSVISPSEIQVQIKRRSH